MVAKKQSQAATSKANASGQEVCCCPQAQFTAESSGEAQNVTAARTDLGALFGKFMVGVNAPTGTIGVREKELINWGLVVLSRCKPCVKIHYDKALKMGISKQELDEVAWLAISMGGAPVMMFYKEALKEIESVD